MATKKAANTKKPAKRRVKIAKTTPRPTTSARSRVRWGITPSGSQKEKSQ